jgi:hypothetical protein
VTPVCKSLAYVHCICHSHALSVTPFFFLKRNVVVFQTLGIYSSIVQNNNGALSRDDSVSNLPVSSRLTGPWGLLSLQQKRVPDTGMRNVSGD